MFPLNPIGGSGDCAARNNPCLPVGGAVLHCNTGSVRKKTKQRCERCMVMLPAPFAQRGARWDGGSLPLLFAPPSNLKLTSGSLFRFCLSGRMARERLESTAVISPLLPVTFYSFPSSRPSSLEETDTAPRVGSRGARV